MTDPDNDRIDQSAWERNTAPADDTDERVEQLAAEIDETREGLTETIAAIGEKLEPANLAREAGETVRATTLGKVEQMTYGAQETWRDVTSGNTGGLVDTIKSNPVPAGMAALGIAMLFMNRGKQGQYDRPASWNASGWDRRPAYGGGSGASSSSSASGGGNPLSAVGDAVSGAAGTAGETVGHVAEQAGQTVGRLADNVGQAAGELPQQAGRYVGQGTSQVRRFLDENPMGAGVIAVAAGAALGMLLPSTSLEREALGPTRNQVIGQAETTVHEALDSVEEQVGA